MQKFQRNFLAFLLPNEPQVSANLVRMNITRSSLKIFPANRYLFSRMEKNG